MKDTHLIREAQQIKLLMDRIIKIVKSKKLEPDFDPSMKTLTHIMKFMTENGAEGRTQLLLVANLNYTILAKHIVWLEKKGLAELTIDPLDSKINVVLTKSGREFASMISKLI